MLLQTQQGLRSGAKRRRHRQPEQARFRHRTVRTPVTQDETGTRAAHRPRRAYRTPFPVNAAPIMSATRRASTSRGARLTLVHRPCGRSPSATAISDRPGDHDLARRGLGRSLLRDPLKPLRRLGLPPCQEGLIGDMEARTIRAGRNTRSRRMRRCRSSGVDLAAPRHTSLPAADSLPTGEDAWVGPAEERITNPKTSRRPRRGPTTGLRICSASVPAEKPEGAAAKRPRALQGQWTVRIDPPSTSRSARSPRRPDGRGPVGLRSS